MTAPSKAVAKSDAPERGTRILETLLSLAKTPEERERAYGLAERYRQSQMVATMSEELAALSWGEKISPVARAQVVRYALEIGADPLRHVFVLGNRVYLNGEYYREVVAQMPDFLRGEVSWLHPDKRATDEENARRLNLRIEHAIPDEVAGKPILAAALVTLYFKERGPFTGTKWSPSNKNDPVGTEFPTLAAETRAWRRAAMKATSPWLSRHPFAVAAERALEAQRSVATTLPDQGPGSVPLTEPERIEIAPVAAPQAISDGEPAPPQSPKMVQHVPSKICPIVGDHEETSCGYKRKGDPK